MKIAVTTTREGDEILNNKAKVISKDLNIPYIKRGNLSIRKTIIEDGFDYLLVVEKDRIVMKGSLQNDKETEKCLKETRKFYKKLRKLENDFNVRFNIPETIDEEDITNVFEICDLLEKGVVKTSGGKITIKSDQIQIEQGSIEDLIKQKYIALMYHYQKIEVLNVELPIANFLRIVHFSDDMSLNSDGDIEMNCNRVYAYNEKKATLTEAEIINNLANEKLVITR